MNRNLISTLGYIIIYSMLSFGSNNIEAQKISILGAKEPLLKRVDNTVNLYYHGFDISKTCSGKVNKFGIIYDEDKKIIDCRFLSNLPKDYSNYLTFNKDKLSKNYFFVYKVIDSCGNVDSISYFLDLKKAPIQKMSCIEYLETDLFPTTNDVWIDAKQFYTGSLNGDDPPLDLRIEKSERLLDFILEVPQTEFIREECPDLIQVRVWGRFLNGTWDFCESNVFIQNNMGATVKNPANCKSMNHGGCFGEDRVGGSVKTASDKTIINAVIKADISANTLLTTYNSKEDGYFFRKPWLSKVNISLSKNDDPLNGISTYDLILLNRHILGNQVITDKYTLIAADINKSGKVTTSDAVELRKMILGLQKSFNNNESWRFFNSLMQEKSIVESLTRDTIINYTGVKIGDINGNANAASAPRALQTIHFDIEDKTLNESELYTLTLGGIDGFGFTLNYDSEKLVLLSLDENSALLENGVITTAQLNSEFKAIFRAKANILLSKALIINSNVTKAEAVVNDELFDLALNFKHQNASFELFQNQPNPFRGETKIAFMLPEESRATIKIFNQNGQIIKQIEGVYAKGYNELKINDFSTSGIYFYQLETSTHRAMKKLIILD